MSRLGRKRTASKSGVIRAAWKASRFGLLTIFVLSIFINILRFVTPYYLLHVLDRVPASRSVETLVMLTAAAIVAILTGLALDGIRRRMLARWGIWIEQRFGAKLLDRSLNDAISAHSSIARQSLDDLSKLRSFVTRSATSWLDLIWAPLFFFGVYLIHPLLGALTLGAVGLLMLSGVVQEAISREPRRAARQASSEAGQIVLAAERNIETVGALSMSPTLIEKWRRSVFTQHDERDRSEASATFYLLMRRAIGQCLRIGIIGVGIWLFLQHSLTLGGMFAARVMAGYGYRLVEKAARSWVNLKEAIAAYKNVKMQLAEDEVRPVSYHSSTYNSAVLIEDVSFRYPGGRDHIFRKFRLEILPGELVLVIGGAATGKTTLSRLIVGRILPNRGRINIGDIELTRLPAEVRAELVGYLPQHTELFSGTVRQNIARMSDGAFEDIIAAARRAGVHETILRLPQGYDTEISDDISGLSGSERKRIALARAFYRSPRLVVLDEPAANLDRPSRRVLEAALRELKNEGASIILTQTVRSPRLEKIADKVVTLGGRFPVITRSGAVEERPEERSQSVDLRSVG
ncbi:type I secretion system permease/ATPase [Microvirga massiliensis]|uniref:type I secretion system permease/ATPase n=1 Tax=Microvirga massiliensis TaxID=1033741 RepID=UPI0006608BDF|nr:ATP-binding cassette domain-containing protein [Microvirga massiliensis]